MAYSFMRTFAGVAGEDPSEYIEDVELYADRMVELHADRTGGTGVDQARLDRERRYAFRIGLTGDAKHGWYLKLSQENRSDWGRLSALFQERFQFHRWQRDQERGLRAQVHTFARRPGETLHSFVERGVELRYQCTDSQQRDLRDRLYEYMVDGDRDHDLRRRVGDRLFGAKLMAMDGRLSDTCTFNDVRDLIISCTIEPGQTYNSFFDDRRPRSKATTKTKTPVAQETLMLEAAEAMKETSLALKAMQDEVLGLFGAVSTPVPVGEQHNLALPQPHWVPHPHRQ